ncbi:MAG: hypothetical protein Pg6A_19700 [Termitinemataceae bacterium]|nr:MAG: hypothetical protein Pg6A_19700 [Termitinemataceae bacterium]
MFIEGVRMTVHLIHGRNETPISMEQFIAIVEAIETLADVTYSTYSSPMQIIYDYRKDNPLKDYAEEKSNECKCL